MEIKCTVQEFKELLKKEIPVAGTTDVIKKKIELNGRDVILRI